MRTTRAEQITTLLRHDRPGLVLAFVVVLAWSIVPIWSVWLPPLVDYPGHLARSRLLAGAARNGPLSRFYRIDMRVLPNLAMDLVVPAMARVLPLEICGKLFLSLVLALISTGVLALNHALFGRVSWASLSVFLLLYNRVFLWGFLNFLFGVGVGLWCLAFWIALRERTTVLRLAVSALGAVTLFTCHIAALGAYAIASAGYEAWMGARVDWRRYLSSPRHALVFAAQFVLPGLLFVVWIATGTGTRSGAHLAWGAVSQRLIAVTSLFNNYDLTLDAITLVVVFGCLVLPLVTRDIAIARPALWMVAFLVVAYLVVPEAGLSGSSVGVRLPPVAALVLAAGIHATRRTRLLRVVVAVLCVVFAVRMATIHVFWADADRTYRGVREAMRSVEPGERIAAFVHYPGAWKPFPTPVTHAVCMAVVTRSAFVPSMQIRAMQQPLRLTPEGERIADGYRDPNYTDGREPDWRDVAARFDYALVFNGEGFSHLSDGGFTALRSGPGFVLYSTGRSAH